MSLNQRSLWHQMRQQQNILSRTPACWEIVPERASDLELSTAEMLRRTQEELQWYRRLYDNTPTLCFSLNVTGIILSVNQFGANRIGYTPEQLIQNSVFDLFHQSDQYRLYDIFINLLKASLESEFTGEFRLDCPNSKIAWVKVIVRILSGEDVDFPLEPNQWMLTPMGETCTLPDSHQSPVVFMVCEDITAYKQAEIDITEYQLAEVSLKQSQAAAQLQLEEFESLNRLKEEFLGTVSHELRTPLTNMKMAIQMLGIALQQEQNFLLEMAKPVVERSKAARYFEILNNECDREINLINNFLDLQRLDTNAKPWVLETIQVQQWLWRVVELFKTRDRTFCQQNLHLNIAPNLPAIVCDPFSLERVLVELLTNACKFSPSDAEIIICAQLKAQNIQFQVINMGVEIPKSELTRIFDKFYRIPSNDPWKKGGTGLGLALVKKLTNHLGGTIEVESGANRTCFTIQLPLSSQTRA